jgi:hypothetical protein
LNGGAISWSAGKAAVESTFVASVNVFTNQTGVVAATRVSRATALRFLPQLYASNREGVIGEQFENRMKSLSVSCSE